MIFGMLRVLNGVPKGGIPKSQVKPTPVHSGVAWLILLSGAAVITIGIIAGLPSVYGLLTACIIVFPLLILGSLFVKGVQEHTVRQRQLQKLPDLPNPETELWRTQQMRARTAVLGKPAPRHAKAAPATAPAPRIVTHKQLVKDTDLDERMKRVAGILLADCPACGADSIDFCKYMADEPTYLLDRERTLVGHAARIGHAVKTHTAKLEDVKAQFNGNIPDDVWRYAL